MSQPKKNKGACRRRLSLEKFQGRETGS